jgi:hypothetical protein
MKASYSCLYAVAAAVGICGPATSQTAPTSTPVAPLSTPAADTAAERAAQEAMTAAEEIAIVRALAPLQLSRDQLGQLLPSLESAQARLTDLEQKEQARQAGQAAALEQARRDLLSGRGIGNRAVEQFNLARATAAQRRAGLRTELVASLRRALSTIVSASQTAQMAQSGQAVVMSQRTGGWRGGGGAGFGGPGRGGGRGAGGSGNPMADRLDRIRAMSPADFQEFAQRAPGRDGNGRTGGRDPQERERMTAFMNQVRNMPHSQYLLQRDQLAAQFMAGRGPGGAVDPEAASNAFVDRYLLSPRAPAAVRGLLQAQ